MGSPIPRFRLTGHRRAGAHFGQSQQRGFSYLFTLLAVALLGVGLAIVGELDSLVAKREREAALLQVGHEFREALARHRMAKVPTRAGQYPTQLEDLLRDQRANGTLRHLRRLYVDPITGQPQWGLVKEGGRIVGVYSLSNEKPLKQDGFGEEDLRFRGALRYRDWVFTDPPDRPVRVAGPDGAASQPDARQRPFQR